MIHVNWFRPKFTAHRSRQGCRRHHHRDPRHSQDRHRHHPHLHQGCRHRHRPRHLIENRRLYIIFIAIVGNICFTFALNLRKLQDDI